MKQSESMKFKRRTSSDSLSSSSSLLLLLLVVKLIIILSSQPTISISQNINSINSVQATSTSNGSNDNDNNGNPNLEHQHPRGAHSRAPRVGARVWPIDEELPVAAGQQQQAASELATPTPQSVKPAASDIRNITAQNGQSIVLPCTLEPTGDSMSVSWIRGTSDLQLLTFGSETIISDDRFRIRNGLAGQPGLYEAAPSGDKTTNHLNMNGNSNDKQQQQLGEWALQIKNVEKNSDSGIYQCQLNSDPVQSQYFQLNIVEPQVHILGAPDLTVKHNHQLNLSCLISQAPEQFQYVFWKKDDRVIGFDLNQSDRGKVIQSRLAHRPHTALSNLLIYQTKPSDSGNYTCSLAGAAQPASVLVHVLDDESRNRLSMFQSDYQYEPPTQASQRNGAASSQGLRSGLIPLRITPSRLLALSAAFIILHSWLQLILQTQTAISLLLVAIIGLFLGKLTEEDIQDDRKSSKKRRIEEDDAGDNTGSELLARQELDSKDAGSSSEGDYKFEEDYETIRYQRKQHEARQLDRSSARFSLVEQEREALIYVNPNRLGHADSLYSTPNRAASPLVIDPLLLRRANSALNLLRNLADATSQQLYQFGVHNQTEVPQSTGLDNDNNDHNDNKPATTGRGGSVGDCDQSSGHHSLDTSDERSPSDRSDQRPPTGHDNGTSSTHSSTDSSGLSAQNSPLLMGDSYTNNNTNNDSKTSSSQLRCKSDQSAAAHCDETTLTTLSTSGFGPNSSSFLATTRNQPTNNSTSNQQLKPRLVGEEIELCNKSTALSVLMDRLIADTSELAGSGQQEPHYMLPSALMLRQPVNSGTRRDSIRRSAGLANGTARPPDQSKS